MNRTTSTLGTILMAGSALLATGCPADAPEGVTDAGEARHVAEPNAPLTKSRPELKVGSSDRFQLPLGDSPSGGPAEALVTAVLFGDLTDPGTARAFFWLQNASVERPGELRWVFKHYPSVRPGDTGMLAHKAAVVAAENKSFESFASDLLSEPGPVDGERLSRLSSKHKIGKLIGPAVDEVERLVNADRRLAARLGVKGPPGLFFNGRRVGLEEPQLQAALKRELSEARELVAKGTPVGQVYERLTRDGRRSAWMKIRAPRRPVNIGDKRARTSKSPDDRQTVLVSSGHGPGLGPAGAPVELVVFVELGCSLCARVIPLIEKLHRDHPRDLHVSLRVLPDRRKRQALLDTAVGLLALADQPRAFGLVLAALKGAQDRRALAAAAERLGMEAGALAAALDEPQVYLDRLAANRKAAEHAGVRGSPYLFVNGRPIPGLTNIERIERMIAEELARTGGR